MALRLMRWTWQGKTLVSDFDRSFTGVGGANGDPLNFSPAVVPQETWLSSRLRLALFLLMRPLRLFSFATTPGEPDSARNCCRDIWESDEEALTLVRSFKKHSLSLPTFVAPVVVFALYSLFVSLSLTESTANHTDRCCKHTSREQGVEFYPLPPITLPAFQPQTTRAEPATWTYWQGRL